MGDRGYRHKKNDMHLIDKRKLEKECKVLYQCWPQGSFYKKVTCSDKFVYWMRKLTLFRREVIG